jgi:hypothetical protein
MEGRGDLSQERAEVVASGKDSEPWVCGLLVRLSMVVFEPPAVPLTMLRSPYGYCLFGSSMVSLR